jgi:monoamine oxidase
MSTEVIIVGGGLSGLVAAWRLHHHGIDTMLIEGRPRLGGRVLTVAYGDGFFDLGPSWVWHGQPHVTGLLDHFGISTYEQFCHGELLHQRDDGAIRRDGLLKPMQHSLRIQGGIGALIKAMADDLPAEIICLNTAVTGLAVAEQEIAVTGDGPHGPISWVAGQVALAVPPRLAARVSYQPALGEATMRSLRSIPTWMAGQAKVVAIYDTPFWREQGLSGDVLSRRGPLAEIHDASPLAGGPYALFGFVGLDAATRAKVGETGLIRAATAQLVDLFGTPAGDPRQLHLMDWSTQELTAAPADRQALDHHPQYGLAINLDGRWRTRLHFIGSETGFAHGGLVEGALHQGLAFAASVLDTKPASAR